MTPDAQIDPAEPRPALDDLIAKARLLRQEYDDLAVASNLAAEARFRAFARLCDVTNAVEKEVEARIGGSHRGW